LILLTTPDIYIYIYKNEFHMKPNQTRPLLLDLHSVYDN